VCRVRDATAPGPNALLLAVSVAAIPAVLWGVLYFVRPEHVAVWGDSVFGDRIATAQALLVVAGFISLITAAMQHFRSWRWVFVLVGLLVCTAPATVLVWYGGSLVTALKLHVDP
jgi:MFS family permease